MRYIETQRAIDEKEQSMTHSNQNITKPMQEQNLKGHYRKATHPLLWKTHQDYSRLSTQNLKARSIWSEMFQCF